MFANYKKKLENKPWLIFLVVILSCISIASIKPNFYLMGWDNYSSYFNLPTNIFRTFFATWRDYRGLGVPSDSESTDFFRQIFFLILNPFVKQGLLDQIYSIGSFNLGVIMVYFLSKRLFKNFFKEDQSKLDFLGFVAAFFYIFNLNTLATFYFPMIMYINRFYTIPMLFSIFLTLIQDKLSWKKTVFYSLLIVVSSGTYMTATIFITALMSLGLFLLIQSQNIKKTIVFISFFVVLNSFWLFPFVNYTINKSKTVYLGPTFIDANEIQLNKPTSFYSLSKQLILYPNFFDNTVTSFNGNKGGGIHPLVSVFDKLPYSFFVSIFPIFYAGGAIFLLFSFKKNHRLLWIPTMIFLFTFLTLKEFSPLGFIYIFLEKNIPYFGSLFRFGDTKFHYFIAFAGSLASGFFITFLWSKLRKKIFMLLGLLLILATLFTYKSYFNGQFFGFFDINQVPSAYFEIANIINKDQGDYRVLSLPFDNNRYWRTYKWGYLGSSFFNFMIDSPFIDKTFEPASAENIQLDSEIFSNINNSFQVSPGQMNNKSQNFYKLLQKVGIKYIIFDNTISPQIPGKGIGSWGSYNFFDSKSMIDSLESQGLIEKKSTYKVNINDYIDIYDKVFSLDSSDVEFIKNKPNSDIILYQLKAPALKFGLVNDYSQRDSKLPDFNIDPNLTTLENGNDSIFTTSPLKRKDLLFSIVKGRVITSLDNIKLTKNINYNVSISTNNTKTPQTLVEVYAHKDIKNIYFDFYNDMSFNIGDGNSPLSAKVKIKEISIPLLQTASVDIASYVSNWPRALPYEAISGLRMKIGMNIIPIPSKINSTETYVGSLILEKGEIPVEVLQFIGDKNIDLNNLKLTTNPNCFSDKLKDYYSSVDYNGGKFSLDSQNGSTCFTLTLKDLVDTKINYSELKLNYFASSTNLDSDYGFSLKNISKPILKSSLNDLPKPNYLLTCIKDSNINSCFNTHQIIDLKQSDSIIIPTDREINAYQPVVSFVLKSIGYQKQNLVINNASVGTFKSLIKDSVVITPNTGDVMTFTVNNNQPLTISFPLPLNYYSFYQDDKDGFYVSNGPCAAMNSYRTFRKTDNLLSYVQNCDNNLFQTLNFNSNNSYIWSIDYNLASGKFPRFSLKDGFFNYVDQYTSINQGYPDILGFKLFQNPELFANKEDVFNKINNFYLKNTNVILSNDPYIDDIKNKNFSITEDAENEGLMAINNFNVIQVPNLWENLSISQEDNKSTLTQKGDFQYEEVLPSLFKIKLNLDTTGNHILKFNEGYDKQWGIYKNIPDLLFDKRASLKQYKCDGYANCFLINLNTGDFLIFYWPEKLNLFGWLVTLLIVFLGKRIVSN